MEKKSSLSLLIFKNVITYVYIRKGRSKIWQGREETKEI